MSHLILLVFVGWLLWLYYRDSRERSGVSRAIWIAVAWAVIYGSRPVTDWFSSTQQSSIETADEGNLIEGLISLSLIVAGAGVLFRRRLRWTTIIRANAWLFIFYSFWFLSVFWSDYSIITFKRLFRDLGTVVIALVVLTEEEPGEALRAVCARMAYLCAPLSVILIRYFPEWGRAYAGYSKNEVMWVGVATHKNTLGVLAMVGAVILLWDLLDRGEGRKRRMTKISMFMRMLVLAMCWHLLIIADSVTSILCAALGSVLLFALRLPVMKQRLWRLEIIAVVVGVAVMILDMKDALLESVGRDPTLTTRTEIWPLLLQLQPNSVVGAGFNSFWAGERLKVSQEQFGGIFQAHNGYLETYLNGGWIGVMLLATVLVSAYWRIRKQFVEGVAQADIRFAVLVIAIVSNYSEASFNKIGILWLLTVLVILESAPLASSRKVTSPPFRASAMG
jgi:exopolysaccharide production protein ExoQ